MSPDTTSTIPTVTDNLYTEGAIAENVLSISFEPLTNTSANATQMNGELIWGMFIYYLTPDLEFHFFSFKNFSGGIDSSKFIDDITYA